MAFRVLLVDDDAALLSMAARGIQRAGFSVVTAANGAEACERLVNEEFHAVVSDLRMPHMDGHTLLRFCRERPDPPRVILMTGAATLDSAVRALRDGADDYLLKPFEMSVLANRVRALCEERQREVLPPALPTLPPLVGSARWRDAFTAELRRIAASRRPALVVGEPGSGKSLVARHIWAASPRFAAPLLEVQCDAHAPGMLERQLRGLGDAAGALRDAAAGTVILEGIDRLEREEQAFVAQLLADLQFAPIQSEKREPPSVRLIATSEHDLRKLAQQGAFDADLAERLGAEQLVLPPLRERLDDVMLLVAHFVRMRGTTQDEQVFSPRSRALLATFSWPGNVKQLSSTVANLVREHAAPIGPTAVQRELARLGGRFVQYTPLVESVTGGKGLADFVEECEAELIMMALRETLGNVAAAARLLHVPPATLARKLRKLGESTEES